ncbi:MAG TPA: ferritin-like domain-containing protein [Blastocatellia bacterium]|nr:ferritin-like domain-containing protein [Blastocatellia bacterium]
MDNNGATASQKARSNALSTESTNVLDTALYYHLFLEAEKVRWKMSDIPWSSIERDKVSPELIVLIRETAFSELTTWSATNRFFNAFADDVDFTQWIGVWLYEETKHPQALMRWLRCFGEHFDTEFIVEGRKTQPFINSRMATLVMNILSEIEASTFYLSLSQLVREPVLNKIVRNLSADEARHSTSFYSYAQRMIDSSENPDVERMEALKILHFWMSNNKKVKHPITIFANRISSMKEFADLAPNLGFQAETMLSRMRQMISKLVGFPLETKDDVREHFTRLQRQWIEA